MTDRPVARAVQRRWREAEATFFAETFADPGMYGDSLALVRALADGLRDLSSEAELEQANSVRTEEWAEERLRSAGMGLADSAVLDFAIDAAFNLRLNELRAEIAARATASRLAAAREAGETWVTSADGEVGFPGHRTYRRVDIHATAGLALYGYSAGDWEKGVTYWLEVVPVDPQTGERRNGAPLVARPRSYRDREALDRAFTRARLRHGAGK